ncbi:MAG: Uncharacterised protein [Gammaproteobacteria bacterium]|nr:MAG: Uncharacterised protein [Gammaproteobacteria bacterium]|tara:strand:- start:1430 stop:1642 length:213 start_codon:yes stop_codon:yes gene_type:complete
MELVQLFLFIMIVLTLLNGLIFFKRLIKLQEENNKLLTKLLSEKQSSDNSQAMASEDLEKLKTEYMKNMR